VTDSRQDRGSVTDSEDGDCDDEVVRRANTPPFLTGEEAQDEIGLSDGKKTFINTVLKAAEMCVL
jgi:hypothetical protein